MDLKLKDKVTKLLIASPGISIAGVAKRTRNYYSYTHKLLSRMERDGLIHIEKVKRGNREITRCFIASDYKREWVSDLKRLLHSLSKDVEVKAAVAVMYLSIILLLVFPQTPQVFAAPRPGATPAVDFNWTWIILIIVPVLLVIHYFRKRK